MSHQEANLRLKEVKISQTGILELDIMELKENVVLVISEGRAKMASLPYHAETSIVTYKGKVKRVNFDEGEDF